MKPAVNLRTALRSSWRASAFTREYPERVMYSFRPKPEPAELEALVVALERLPAAEDERPDPYRSRWRRAALEESVAPVDEDEPER
jgi:hypothetical protein